MNEETRRLYCSLLIDKIVEMYGADRRHVEDWVSKSAIQELIDEMPEYVDHVPLYCWAEDVYEEMLRNKDRILMIRDDVYKHMYDELWAIAHEIQPWYDVDKVKWYSVYIWTKDSQNEPYSGKNVFDICADEIYYYDEGHVIPDDAWPVILKIQGKLKELEIYAKSK